ncbi:UNVERIFIED_CONTAM: hypothetical protein Sradi_4940800 [Sesamum radiatum]|uniref:Uncharacterized protein n=1 Tax=Sesamum radiatum TaxID=300843 RepID=A0AAW2MGA7_SESRA
MPWLILGNFNCVKSLTEKQLGVPPTWYELKEFADCCLTLGLHDAQTTECYYTCPHFNPSGCLSDHSSGIVSIFYHPAPSLNLLFFNVWADHLNFIATFEEGWRLNVEGKPQFRLHRKLKVFKSSLKAFNNLHYGHISVRAKEADLALQNAQTHLESNPGDVIVWDLLGDLKKRIVFLTEAERHFYYQKAKIHFLKQDDRNAKVFHDMVKRNMAKNSILTVTKSDGTIITSAPDIA